MGRTYKAKTLTISINRPAAEVYAFAANVENLPRWATSFVRSVRKTPQGWTADTTEGAMGFEFAAKNSLGVLDQIVRPAPGIEVLVPIRVVPNGDGAEVLFTLIQVPGMPDEKFSRDMGMIERDLKTLKTVLERDAR
jgi:hypothetical protein